MPDLGAVFRTSGFTVRVEGQSYFFPYHCATEWVECAANQSSFIGLADERSYDLFVQRAENGTVDQDTLAQLGRTALSEAAGRPWWEAQRLIGTLSSDSVLGTLLMHGCDPSRMTLAALLSAVWTLLMQGQADDTARITLEAELTMPPPEAAGDETADDDMASMVAAMRSMPGVSTNLG